MRQSKSHQIRVFKLDISHTKINGAFLCPNCGTAISPDDHSRTVYSIFETIMKGDDLEELVIQCKKCLTFIHLVGFTEIYEDVPSITSGIIPNHEEHLYITHI
jgi:predicted RNA-binding Zn-ribbon protein involved in translation (DUF1610 family)